MQYLFNKTIDFKNAKQYYDIAKQEIKEAEEMQKHEFEKLIGHDVSIECYERIEVVYMESERNFDKQGIADFYKQKDMNGIETEYGIILKNREIARLKKRLERKNQRIEVLEKQIDDIHAILIR